MNRKAFFDGSMRIQRVIILALVCFVIYLVLWPHHKQRHDTEFETAKRFSKIGNATMHFFWDHDNQLPLKLSDLVPKYISPDELAVFYRSGMLDPTTKTLPSDWNRNPELIDTL